MPQILLDPRYVRSTTPYWRSLRYSVGALLLSWLLLSMTAHAQVQISDAKVEALVEALRLSAPDASSNASGLYSDWRIKPEQIRSWSTRCLQQELTPEQLAADQDLARQMVVCMIGPIFREQLTASQQNEIVAVQRAAAWWLSGDPEQYRQSANAYTLKVLEAYLRFL